jgi:phospholipid/cholesterol/gamma-HCH transport system substrate-binding protein
MKQATLKTKVFVGGFLVASGLVLFLVILAAGGARHLFRDSQIFKAVFLDAGGLVTGAPVKLGGVDVGNVKSIDIKMRGVIPFVEVSLEIWEPYFELVRKKSAIGMETQGVLGDKYVAFSPGLQSEARLNENDVLIVKEMIELKEVVDKSTDIMNSVKSITDRVDKFAQSLPDAEAMGAVTKNLQASSEALKVVLQSLNSPTSPLRIIQSEKTFHQLQSTLQSFERASLHAVRAAQHAESAAKKVDSGKGTVGLLVNDDSLYDDMKELLGRANRNKAVKFLIRQSLSEPASPSSSPTSVPAAESSNDDEFALRGKR